MWEGAAWLGTVGEQEVTTVYLTRYCEEPKGAMEALWPIVCALNKEEDIPKECYRKVMVLLKGLRQEHLNDGVKYVGKPSDSLQGAIENSIEMGKALRDYKPLPYGVTAVIKSGVERGI